MTIWAQKKRRGFTIMDKKTIVEKINSLRKQKNAIILAHNYQIPEIQDIADFVGDSLELAKKATKTDSENNYLTVAPNVRWQLW
jgi:quinolinate synthase